MARSRNQTIGTDPLDGVILPSHRGSAAIERRHRSGQLDRVTVPLGADLLERVHNAVFWTPGLTLSRLARHGFSLALDELEQRNHGRFPPPEDPVLAGGGGPE